VGIVRRQFVRDEHGIEQAAPHGACRVLPILYAREVPADSLGCRHIPVAWLLTPCWMNPSRWVFFRLRLSRCDSICDVLERRQVVRKARLTHDIVRAGSFVFDQTRRDRGGAVGDTPLQSPGGRRSGGLRPPNKEGNANAGRCDNGEQRTSVDPDGTDADQCNDAIS
jgi:hypothetical protein